MHFEVDIAALMLEESVCWKKEIKVELFGCINCGRQGETLAGSWLSLSPHFGAYLVRKGGSALKMQSKDFASQCIIDV